MNKTRKHAGLVALGIAAVALPLLVAPLGDVATVRTVRTVMAADHVDSPKALANLAADITDVYAWHTGEGKIVVVLDFAGLNEAGLPARFSEDVLYTIHVDKSGDLTSDFDTLVRFGKDADGNWGVQVSGLPGADPVVTGPVGTTIEAGLGLRVWAGLRDDPFFFDLDGFKKTVMSGTLSFDATHDTFAKTNVTSIIVEMSTDAVASAGPIRLWATTRVKQ